MADARCIIVERAGVDLSDEYAESDPTTDELLVKGIKTTSTILTFEDSTNGSVTLSDLLSDELVKVTSNDTTPGYLFSKVVGTSGKIVITELNDGSDEDLKINIGTDVFDTSINDTDDITEGTTNLFYIDERVDDRVASLLIGGTSITLTYDDSAGSITIDNDFAEQVRTSASDSLPEFLEDKLVSGIGISLVTLVDSAGVETIEISASGVSITDELVKITSNDTTPGFLLDKVVGASGKIVLTELFDGFDEDLEISLGGDIFDKTVDDSDDITEGTTNLFFTEERVDDRVASLLVGGISITLTYDDSAGSITIDNDFAEQVRVSASDSLPEFLEDKLVSGTGISLSTLTDSAGVQTVEISASGASLTDELVKVTSNDTTPGFLFDKVVGASGKIVITELFDGFDEDLEISLGSDVFDKSVDDSDDITEGIVNLFFTDERVDDRVATLLVGGTSISISYDDSAGSVTIDNDFAEEVRVSGTDVTPGFLEDKIVSGTGITTTVLIDSFGFETLEISASGASLTDELVKVTSNDTTPGYLFDKLVGASGKIVLTELNDAGDEDLEISLGGDVFDKTVDDTDDLTEGVINLFFTSERVDDRVASLLVGGTSITLTYDDSAGSITIDNDFAEEVRVTGSDITPGFLDDKIVGGIGITTTVLVDSFGVETLEISASGASLTDELIKVTSNDTTPGFLFDKLVGAVGKIVLTELFDGGDEDLEISLGGDVFDKSVDDTDDITEGSINLFFTDERVDDRVAGLLVGGTSITLTYDDSAGSITIDNDFPEQVRVSVVDSLPGYLEDKIVAGSGISLATLTDSSGFQIVEISAPGSSTDELVKVTSNDTTPGFLFDKLVGATGKIVLTELFDGSDEDLEISLGGDVFDKSVDDSDDITEGVTNLFFTEERVDDRVAALLIGGTSITLTYDDSAGSITIDNDFAEQVRVTVSDSTSGFLDDKVVSGIGITTTVLVDSAGVETLEISASGASLTDELVKVTSNDTTPGFLFSKLVGASGKIVLTELSDGGDEDLEISLGGDVFDKSVDDTDDITEGVTNLFFTDERVDDRVASLLVGGTSITLTYDDSAGSITIDNDFAEEVRVSGVDSLPGFLEDKLVAGTGISLATLTDSSGFQTVEISAPGSSTDELVKVTSNDTTPGFLFDKLVGATGKIVLTELFDGGDEDLEISLGGDVFDKSVDDTDDITEGITNLFFTDERVDDRVAALLIGGTSITLTYDDSAGSITIDNDFAEEVRVSAVDSLPGFLEDKFVSGSGITLTTLTDSSGFQVVEIAAPGSSTDELVKVTSNDTTPGYLFDKLVGVSGKIVLTELFDGGDEDLEISLGGDVFDKSVDDTDDITEGTTNLFFTDERVDDRVAALLIGGTSITLTYDDSAGSITIDNDFAEEVRVSAIDSLPGFLEDKLVAGTGISLSTLTDSSGFQTVEIFASGASLTDELVKVTSNDTTSGFLFDKLVGASGKIVITELFDGGDEDLEISLGGDVFDKTIDDSDDITEGSINLFFTDERVDDRVAALLIGGTNITLTYDDSAGSITIDGDVVSIDDLSDVDTTTTTPNTDDLLTFNGSNWVPVAPEDFEQLQTWVHNGGMTNLQATGTERTSWGAFQATAGIAVLRDGELIGFSASLTGPRTSGTATFEITINNVAQTGAGQTFDIDGTNTTSNKLEFSTPISFSAGDIISVHAITSSFAPNSSDATVSFWYRDT
jgi:uncharacterized membrane protein (Fun14 family)